MVIIGNNQIGSLFDRNDPNYKSASYFNSPASGTIEGLFAYVNRLNTVGTAQVACYDVVGGLPTARRQQSNQVAVDIVPQWVWFPFPSPVDVVAFTDYGFAVCSDDDLIFSIVAGTGVRSHNLNPYVDGFSDPFGLIYEGTTDPTGAMSIYADIIPAVEPPPPVTLPLHDDFTDARKWTVIDGVWQ